MCQNLLPSIAVIPAAGMGTRLHPVSYAVPKELFPIGRHAVIEWVIAEAAESGCGEAVVVISPRKRIIEEYLTNHCVHLTNRINLNFCLQSDPRGVGHAILCTKDIVGNNPFVCLYPDSLINTEVTPLVQLAHILPNSDGYVLALTQELLGRDPRYGRINFEALGERRFKLTGIGQKPKTNNSRCKLVGIGRSILPPFYLKYVADLAKHQEQEELDDGDIIQQMLEDGMNIFGLQIEGKFYDISTNYGFMSALESFSERTLL